MSAERPAFEVQAELKALEQIYEILRALPVRSRRHVLLVLREATQKTSSEE